MKNYVLGYGSLINSKSISKTIRREILKETFIPVKLRSFKRKWNLKETVYSNKLHTTIEAIFLNIEKDEVNWLNGVIFEVTDDELELLNFRERKYKRLNVANYIELYSDGMLDSNKVFTYIADEPQFLRSKFSSNSFVMENYIETVKAGCMDFGLDFYTDFQKSTETFEFNLLDGEYSFI